MDSITKELVPNASGELFPDNILRSFYKLFTRVSKLGGAKGDCKFGAILPINVSKHNGGKFQISWRETFNSTSTYNLEPGLYTSITDIVEAMNMLIQERNNQNENWTTVMVSRRTQKVVVLLANDTSGLAFCNNDLGHTFAINVGTQFELLIKG